MMQSRTLALGAFCVLLGVFQIGCSRLASFSESSAPPPDEMSVLILKSADKSKGVSSDLPAIVTTFSQADPESGMRHVEIRPSGGLVPGSENRVHADLASAANALAFEMLKDTELSEEKTPSVVLVSKENFEELSAPEEYQSRDANRLRVELNRAANGRILFLDTVLASLKTSDSNKVKVEYRLESTLREVGRFQEPADQGVSCRQIQVRIVNQESDKIVWNGTCLFRERM